MKWTEPSQKATLTPPGWKLAAVTASIGPPAFGSHVLEEVQDHLFGVFQ